MILVCVEIATNHQMYQFNDFPINLVIEDKGEIKLVKEESQIKIHHNDFIMNKNNSSYIEMNQVVSLEYADYYLPFSIQFTEAIKAFSNYKRFDRPLKKVIVGYQKNKYLIIHNVMKEMNISLQYKNNEWIIIDENKSGHCFYNHEYRNQIQLKSGLVKYGFVTMCFHSDFFMINMIHESVLKEFIVDNFMLQSNQKKRVELQEKFHFQRDIGIETIDLDDFKEVKEYNQSSAMSLVPQRIMALSALCVAIVNITKRSQGNINIYDVLTSILFPITMCFSAIIWPKISGMIQKKIVLKEIKQRNLDYLDYLSKMETLLTIKNEYQLIYQAKRYPCNLNFDNIFTENCLYTHHYSHNDFLFIALGYATIESHLLIQFPIHHKYSKYDLPIKDKQQELIQNLKKIDGGILELDLLKYKIVSFIQNGEGLIQTIKNITIELFFLHSYESVRACLLMDEDKKYDFLSFYHCPHMYSLDYERRYIIHSSQQIEECKLSMLNQLELKIYLVIIVQDNQLLKYMSNEILNHPNTLILYFSEKESEVYSLSNAIIDYDKFEFYENQDTYNSIKFSSSLIHKQLDNLIEEIRVEDKTMNSNHDFGLFACFHASSINQLNVLERWNNPSGLKSTLGIDNNNELIYLDLHETKDGPHGLIAGSTGSGKSELLLTCILSLAIQYSPVDLQFVLIDYKGGSSQTALYTDGIKLPHLVATLTNQDGQSINRSLYLLKQECVRRQRFFLEASRISNKAINNLDLYKLHYNLYSILSSLGHLVIIIDEFAELKKEKPEFLKECISIARIGRSLGIHLILATQKPTGIVDDQILSNVHFRICLKVQDEQDSKEVIQNRLAATINKPGYFYMKTSERFIYGKSAYCHSDSTSRPYQFEIVDSTLKATFKQCEMDVGFKSDVQRLIPYLDTLAKEHHLECPPLWNEFPLSRPLSTFVHEKNKIILGTIDNVEQRSNINCQYNAYEDNCLCLVSNIQENKNLLHIFAENSSKQNLRSIYIGNNFNENNELSYSFNEFISLSNKDNVLMLMNKLEKDIQDVVIFIDDLMQFIENLASPLKLLSLLRNHRKNRVSFTCAITSLAGFKYTYLDYFDVLVSYEVLTRSQQKLYFNQTYLFDNNHPLFYHKRLYEFAPCSVQKIEKRKKRNLIFNTTINYQSQDSIILGLDKELGNSIVIPNKKPVLVLWMYEDSYIIFKKQLIPNKMNRIILEDHPVFSVTEIELLKREIIENKYVIMISYTSYMKSKLRTCVSFDVIVWLGNGANYQTVFMTPSGMSNMLDNEGIISINGRCKQFSCIQ